MRPPREIRDPIHGAIEVDDDEQAVVQHPFVQRLRGIRQLGFSHLPFPGATHTRYAHSLGVMHLAGRSFDSIFRDGALPPERRRALRHCVRLAALCHDLGHAPLSHAAEFAMPPLRALGIDAYDPAAVGPRLDAPALHEDYTVAILTRTDLADLVRARFPFGPEHVAGLISPDVRVEDDFFVEDGRDLRGLLSQLVSSSLDADRLDYLVRDAYHTGARYGEVDVNWLISHLGRHTDADGRTCLALDQRALYAFDDFMIARYHMFVMVYFHRRSVAYEQMLRRAIAAMGWRLPAELDRYLRVDDVELLAWLRRSDDPWARRIVEQRPYQVAVEVHGHPDEIDVSAERAALVDAGVDVIEASATSAILAPRKASALPIYVHFRRPGRAPEARPLAEVASIFQRYSDAQAIVRLYVDDLERATRVLARM